MSEVMNVGVMNVGQSDVLRVTGVPPMVFGSGWGENGA